MSVTWSDPPGRRAPQGDRTPAILAELHAVNQAAREAAAHECPRCYDELEQAVQRLVQWHRAHAR